MQKPRRENMVLGHVGFREQNKRVYGDYSFGLSKVKIKYYHRLYIVCGEKTDCMFSLRVYLGLFYFILFSFLY